MKSLSRNARRRIEKRAQPLIETVTGTLAAFIICPSAVRICGEDKIKTAKRVNYNRLAVFELKIINSEGKQITAFVSSTLKERARNELRIGETTTFSLQRSFNKFGKQQFEVIDFKEQHNG